MGATEPPPSAPDWIEVGPVSAIPQLGARVVRTLHGDIAVFRNQADEIFALADRCPHRGGPLSQGIITGRNVICPLHDWCIRLPDGCAEAPDTGTAPRYPVRVEAGVVYLTLAPA